MIQVRVYYPEFADGESHYVDWSTGATRPQRLNPVFAFDTESAPSDVPELAFAILNSYPDELHCPTAYADVVAAWRDTTLRSLSVGDVVVVEGVAWLCCSLGFRVLGADDLAGIEFVI